MQNSGKDRRDIPAKQKQQPSKEAQDPTKPLEEKQKIQQEKTLGKENKKEPFTKRINDLFENPKDILMKMYTFFPFDLFPDTITINPLMIRIVSKEFFATEEIKTVLIKDIEDVEAESSVFLATLKIIDRKDKAHPILIKPLKKKDAEKAEKIIEGLLIARMQEGDVAKVQTVG